MYIHPLPSHLNNKTLVQPPPRRVSPPPHRRPVLRLLLSLVLRPQGGSVPGVPVRRLPWKQQQVRSSTEGVLATSTGSLILMPSGSIEGRVAMQVILVWRMYCKQQQVR